MDRTTLWVLGGLIGVVLVSGLALAGLERVRGLRATPRADGTVRPARAFALVEMLGGISIVLLAVATRAWLGVGAGVWMLALGAAEFTRRRTLRDAVQWAGLVLVLAVVAIQRLAR